MVFLRTVTVTLWGSVDAVMGTVCSGMTWLPSVMSTAAPDPVKLALAGIRIGTM
jgi:hypothetical protein